MCDDEILGNTSGFREQDESEKQEWILRRDGEFRITVVCSGCGSQACTSRKGYYLATPYCAGCGAQMDPIMTIQRR